MCKVLNAGAVGKRTSATQVYIGRPSKWGNPFVIGRDGSRAEVIAKYRAWIVAQPGLMGALDELRGTTSSAGARRSRAMATCWSTSPTGADHSFGRSNLDSRSDMSSSFIAAAVMASATSDKFPLC